jgi:hypothetical protein
MNKKQGILNGNDEVMFNFEFEKISFFIGTLV